MQTTTNLSIIEYGSESKALLGPCNSEAETCIALAFSADNNVFFLLELVDKYPCYLSSQLLLFFFTLTESLRSIATFQLPIGISLRFKKFSHSRGKDRRESYCVTISHSNYTWISSHFFPFLLVFC
jgi:hypothetical protein